MRFCKYCGTQIDETDTRCPQCGKELKPATAPAKSGAENLLLAVKHRAQGMGRRKLLAGAAAALVLVAILSAALGAGKCRESGCHNKAVSGSSYCYSHKCAVPSCDERRFSTSNYCYSHYLVYDDAQQSSSYVPSYQLKISGVSLSSNSSYTIAEGTITNNSDETVSFVKIKGSFETSSGTVVDTDWTYAVGSEGLAPGESCKWRMSVAKDYSIKDCTVTILDYDY